tara:strand:- start:21587 stop:23257 length:1671 start_codon:yes stop_codon:yes gene_type:complete
MLKFVTNDQYGDNQNYEIVKTDTFEKVEYVGEDIVRGSKLFSNDIFNFENNIIEIVHSPLRLCENIPGVLDIKISYGKKKDKLLYLCKADDKRLPAFLIPYRVPYNFDKSIHKIYITFSYNYWNECEDPIGSMRQNFGKIQDVNNYYEYILYCKSLNVSIQKFTKTVKEKLNKYTCEEINESIVKKYNISRISKKDEHVFTIDTNISNDHDDAISYNFKENKITVYITNVALIMDYLELWDSFTNRISTIYLPDKKRPMMPTILNNVLHSLNEKHSKLCYALDMYYDDNNNIIRQELKLCYVYISKNYTYDDVNENKYYCKMSKMLKINNSRDLITHLMLYFNHYVADYLSKENYGIYRILETHSSLTLDNQNNVPTHIYDYIINLKRNGSRYDMIKAIEDKSKLYLQITSPMRRLVDIINNISLLKMMGIITEESKAIQFHSYWTHKDKIEYINICSRSIRKIQSKCKIYSQYLYDRENDIDTKYQGYVFDKILKEDSKYKYMVYIPKLNLTTYITILQHLNNYSCHLFKLFVFMDQEKDKNKIKLQIYISQPNI